MVLGYEAAGRISAAMPRFRERGFHGCHGAIFAAAVASGVLLRLDAERLAQAIALSNERVAVQILARRMTASVQLIQALGGGWDASALNKIQMSSAKPEPSQTQPRGATQP